MKRHEYLSQRDRRLPLRESEGMSISNQITIDLPDDAFSALRSSQETFVKEMRLAAAAKWYEIGLVSQSKAAALAGISRERFLEALSRFHVSPFQETPDELSEELNRE